MKPSSTEPVVSTLDSMSNANPAKKFDPLKLDPRTIRMFEVAVTHALNIGRVFVIFEGNKDAASVAINRALSKREDMTTERYDKALSRIRIAGRDGMYEIEFPAMTYNKDTHSLLLVDWEVLEKFIPNVIKMYNRFNQPDSEPKK
jgi:hypothetical protein